MTTFTMFSALSVGDLFMMGEGATYEKTGDTHATVLGDTKSVHMSRTFYVEPVIGRAAQEARDVALEAAAARVEPIDSFYTVQAGDTLVRIANLLLGKASAYRVIFAANQELTNPNQIEVGQVLLVPGAVIEQAQVEDEQDDTDAFFAQAVSSLAS